MKEIIAFMLVFLLSMIALVPTASGSISEFSAGYPPGDNTLIESDPPVGDPPPDPDLAVNDKNPWDGDVPGSNKVFEVAGVMPGDSGAATLKLQNVGGNGTLELQLLNLVDEPLITPEPEPTPDDGELSQNLDMLIWWDDNQNGVYDEPLGETKVAEGTLYDIAGVIYGLGSLDYNETKYLGMRWSINSTAGDEIMRDRCTFDIKFGIY